MADAALAAGASLVNDVSGLALRAGSGRGRRQARRADRPDAHARAVARHVSAGVYSDVVDEVLDELRESMAFAAGAGIPKERAAGGSRLGFAKEAPHSYEVLARLTSSPSSDVRCWSGRHARGS